jgi:hypothetical protein
MTSEQQFIDMLRLHEGRRALAIQMKRDPDRLSCYYLCPVTNLARILSDGIKCRNAVSGNDDLSASDVQHRRDSVWVGRSTNRPRFTTGIPVHSCVNLFWNPLNRTFEAFQRNGLIRAAANKALQDAEVCILEIDVESLLLDSTVRWGATPTNIASKPWATVDFDKLSDPTRFDWNAIFAADNASDNNVYKRRQAELIVFSGTGPTTLPISSQYFRSVITSSRAKLDASLRRVIEDAGLPLVESESYKTLAELCQAERWFLTYLDRFRRDHDPNVVAKLVRAFHELLAFEKQVGTPNQDQFMFGVPEQAYRYHGIGHVVRVMFWSQFLLSYENSATDCDRMASGLAALIHDLRRKSDEEDRHHGEDAAQFYTQTIQSAFSPRNTSMERSVANASTMHCRPDEECSLEHRDLIWRVLKDADAIDRGRFGIPNQQNGCDTKMLRCDVLKTKAGSCIPSVATHLATHSKLHQWGKRPCLELCRSLVAATSAAQQVAALPSTELHELASRIIEGLESLLESQPEADDEQ